MSDDPSPRSTLSEEAAAQGRGPGARVTELDAKPLKSLGALQRALTAAADSGEGGGGNVTLTVAPPQPVLAASAKQRRRGLKRSSSAAKTLRAAAKAGADGTPDPTDAFFAAAQELITMGEALGLAEGAGDGEGGGIDLEKAFAVPRPQGGGSQRTALLPHVHRARPELVHFVLAHSASLAELKRGGARRRSGGASRMPCAC